MNWFRSFVVVGGFFTLIALAGCATTQHSVQRDEVELILPSPLDNSKQEFSSMCWNGDQLWLIPQYPEKPGHAIYAFEEKEVAAALAGKQLLEKYQRIEVRNLDKVRAAIGNSYEGIEAATVANGWAYFTIETREDNAYCFIIRGRIDGGEIIIEADHLYPLKKVKSVSNAGFESMAYMPTLKRLIVFFEYNKVDVGAKAFLINPDLQSKPDTLTMQPLMYRLTDVAVKGKKLFGINYHYNASKTEFPDYIGADSLFNEPDIQGKPLKTTSFARIITLNVGKTIRWSRRKIIKPSNNVATNNWEGIALYKNGALIVTDEFSRTILKWVKL